MSGFTASVKRILRLSRKPSMNEFWFSLKICLLGLLVLGVFSFIIQFMSMILQALPP